MPDVKDLGRRVKAKYPGVYDDLADEDLGRRVKAKYPGAYDDFTDTQKPAPMLVDRIPGPEPQAEPPGFLENLQTGIARGFQNYFVDPFLAIGEAVENAKTGNYVPAAQIAELVGRGAFKSATKQQFNPATMTFPANTSQDEAIAQIQQQQEARRSGNPTFQANRRRQQAIAEQEARDQSLSGRITRGAASLAVGAIPAVVTGIATGGSLPAIAGVTALQSAAEPENLALNVGAAVTPIPVGKLVAPILRRIRGIQGAETGAAEAVARTGQGGTQIINLEGRALPVPEASAGPSPSLAKAIGQDAFDDTKVAVEELGLPHVPQPNRPANAYPVQREIPVDDITLSRDNLSRGRMFQAQEALEQGVKGEGETFTTPGGNSRAVEPIQVVPDPNNPGKFIVQGDGNHRVALLKLQGNNELIPVKSFETEAQSAVVSEALGPGSGRVVTVGDKQYRLTPEQEARWSMEVDEAIANAKQYASQFDPQRASSILKGRMMQISATKREIVGALTAKEEAAIAAREATNYNGKQVMADGQPATVIGAPFGRVKVRLEDGSERIVTSDRITARTQPSPQQMPAPLNEASASLTGDYYNPPMEMPTLGEGGFEAPGLSVSYGEPKRYAGAAGPRITEQGFVEGSNPGVVKPEERTGILKTLSAFFKAGMLTRPNTHLKNIGGNAGFALSEEASRIPAAIADLVVSPFTGRRTITGPSVSAIGKSAYEAATKGRQEAWQIIKNGVSEADAERLALQELNSPSKVLNTYVNGVFRILNAEDRVFRTYAYRRALEDRARSVALTEIRAGELTRGQYGQRVRELVQQPSEDLAANAIADAEVATFTNENLASGAISKARNFLQTTKIPGGKAADFALDLVLPFVKTPANIVARTLEYAGLGGVKSTYLLGKAILKRSMSEAEQRAFAQSFGRASIGLGLIGLGSILYKSGLMTGFTEDDPSRKARDEAAGRIPGSILVGNEWHQVVGFSPIGNLLAIGATIQRESDQERDDALKAFLEAGAQAVGEQPLLAGAQHIASSLRQPGTFVSKTLGGIASGFVPGIVSDVAQTLDTERRQTNTFLGQIENRIPGLRNTLPAKPDVLGQPVPLPFAFDPTKSTTAQEATNPLFAELVRLDQGISGFAKKKDETDEHHAEKVSTFGQLYGQYGLTLINSQPYQNADDAAKREMFHLFNERAKLVVTENEERFAQAKLSPAIIFQAFRESELRKRQKTLQHRTP